MSKSMHFILVWVSGIHAYEVRLLSSFTRSLLSELNLILKKLACSCTLKTVLTVIRNLIQLFTGGLS